MGWTRLEPNVFCAISHWRLNSPRTKYADRRSHSFSPENTDRHIPYHCASVDLTGRAAAHSESTDKNHHHQTVCWDGQINQSQTTGVIYENGCQHSRTDHSRCLGKFIYLRAARSANVSQLVTQRQRTMGTASPTGDFPPPAATHTPARYLWARGIHCRSGGTRVLIRPV